MLAENLLLLILGPLVVGLGALGISFAIPTTYTARTMLLIQVVDPAVPPERKSKPKKALIAVVATLAAGFAILLWVMVRHALRSSASNPASSEKVSRLGLLMRRALGLRAG